MKFCVMLDMSRNAVMKEQRIENFIDTVVAFGYNAIGLYIEDLLEIKNESYFGYLRGRYSESEIKRLDAYCVEKGVELIPFVQTLAHLNGIFRWEEYSAVKDCEDVLLVGEDRTYRLITDILKTVKECFSCRTVHIGMDEAHSLGLGNYLKKHGVCDRAELFAKHLGKVVEIAESLGLEPLIWSDMIFRLYSGAYYENMSGDEGRAAAKAARAAVKGVGLVYWDYYSEDKEHYAEIIRAHKTLSDNVWFAGGCWNWVGYAPLNAHTLKTSLPAMRAAKENGVENVIITVWGDDGGESSRFSVLPSLFYCRKVYDGETDIEVIKREFRRITGENFDDMMKLDLPNYAYGNDGSVANACKYMLFADLFCGFTDYSVDYKCEKAFAKTAKTLAEVKSANYGDLFAEETKLCEILALKCALGKRLRNAYRAGDKKELSRLAKRIKLVEKKIEGFYRIFRKRWLEENKPFGWEVQDIRLGGLICRLRSCRERLEEYIAGGKEIEELSEDILEYYEDGKCGERSLILNGWAENVSVNRLSF